MGTQSENDINGQWPRVYKIVVRGPLDSNSPQGEKCKLHPEVEGMDNKTIQAI